MTKENSIYFNENAELQHYCAEKLINNSTNDILIAKVLNHGQLEELDFFPQSKDEAKLAVDGLRSTIRKYRKLPFLQERAYTNAQSFYRVAREDEIFLEFNYGVSKWTSESMARYLIFKSVAEEHTSNWPTGYALKYLIQQEVLNLDNRDDLKSIIVDARHEALNRSNFWNSSLKDVDHLPSVKNIKSKQEKRFTKITG